MGMAFHAKPGKKIGSSGKFVGKTLADLLR
jgi:hypothetical protein